jgi:uncharacterized protein (TIGR04141 family)
LLRAVTGEPADPALAKRLTGADGLAIHAPVAISGLPAKAAEFLTYQAATTYRARFPWIDNIAPIADDARVRRLDERLIAALRSPGSEILYLAAPEIVDWSGLQFRYHRERSSDKHTRTLTSKPTSTESMWRIYGLSRGSDVKLLRDP